METPRICPSTVSTRRNPHRKARPPGSASNLPSSNSFPDNGLFNVQVHGNLSQLEQIQLPQVMPASDVSSESLKVYLRIRPPDVSGFRTQKPRRTQQKNVWPQNPTKTKIDTRKKKTARECSESCISVNDRFDSATLFPPATLHESKRMKSEVFEGFSRVFLSDVSQEDVYTHMVRPLVEEFVLGKSAMLAALGPSGSGKTYTVFGTPREPGMVPLALHHIFEQVKEGQIYISIFEIYSEQGKVEKICDLSPDGIELYMHQSTVKGLQQIAVSNASHAERLINCSMLKRATAMTNTNSQSSRSQCVITISYCVAKEVEHDKQHSEAVLTIIDLAGSEREKKTGNQGSRLLESSFINKTVMVFSQCLRSLLEHQRNPRKPLQKHFQNSLLTKYLRDYLEGKKRMTLILTVKPGTESYLDTAYLLRQASPFTRIKFELSEEQVKLVTKRHLQTFNDLGQVKRMKHNQSDKNAMTENVEQVCSSDENTVVLAETPKKPEYIIDPSQRSLECSDLSNNRAYNIMLDFSKAVWNVLKDCNKKLKNAEKEIHRLNEISAHDKAWCTELEHELRNLKLKCHCFKKNPGESNLPAEKYTLVVDNSDEQDELKKSDKMPVIEDIKSPVFLREGEVLQCSSAPNEIEALKCTVSSNEQEDIGSEKVENSLLCTSTPSPRQNTLQNDTTLKKRLSDCSLKGDEEISDNLVLPPPEGGQAWNKPVESINEKPRRKLLPASSSLLKGITALDMDDESGISINVNKGGKKMASDDWRKTPGNESLMHLLQKSLRI